jgi:hypothetical protein
VTILDLHLAICIWPFAAWRAHGGLAVTCDNFPYDFKGALRAPRPGPQQP